MHKIRMGIRTVLPQSFPWIPYKGEWNGLALILLIFFLEVIIGLGILPGQAYLMLIFFFLMALSLAIFTRPEWGIIIMPLVIYFPFGPLNRVGFSILDILTIITSASLILSYNSPFGTSYKKGPLDLPISIFLGWTLLSVVWAPGKLHGIPNFLNILLVFITFFISQYAIKTEKTLNYVIGSWIVIALINALIAILSMLIGPTQRQSGLSFNVHTFALLLMFTIFLAFGKYKSCSNPARKCLTACIIIIMLIGLLLSGSKSGWLGFLSGSIFLYITSFFNIPFREKLMKNALKITFHCLVLILFGIILFMNTRPIAKPPKKVKKEYNIITQMLSLTYIEKEEGFAFRRAIWKLGFKLLSEKDRYFHGFGSGGWADYTKGLGVGSAFGAFDKTKSVLKLASIHNFYLTVLFDFGIIGLVFFCWIFKRYITILWASLKFIQEPQKKGAVFSLIAGLIGFAVFGITNFSYIDEILWLYLAYGMAMVKIYSR